MRLFTEELLLEHADLQLTPSSLSDLDGLYQIAEPEIWRHSATDIQSRADMKAYLQRADLERRQHVRQQLTIRYRSNRQCLGCSSFEHISNQHRRLEIGWTWLGNAYQGTGVNRIVKFLMLRFAFETLGFVRVEFRVRGSNRQSQRALKNIGAVREGTLRAYFEDGGKRHDFVYYSILRREWRILQQTVFYTCTL